MTELTSPTRADALRASDSAAPTVTLSVGIALIYLAVLLQLTSPQGVVFGLLTQVAFALPGVMVVRAITGPTRGWLTPLTLGPILGIALSSLTLAALWATGLRNGWLLLPLAPALACIGSVPARRLQGRWEVAAAARTDWATLAVLLLVVPLVVALPFGNVGAPVEDGIAYRAYFTADYVWRRAVVAELAKGDFLPVNPFMHGDALHYYWLPHLLSAVEYRTVGRALGIDHILMMRSVFVDALFIAFLYGVARLFTTNARAAAAGVAVAVLLSSYEGIYALWDLWRQNAPLSLVRYLNIDAIVRWFFQAMPIDGLQRVLLYQPHHATGYALGLMGLLVVARRSRAYDPTAFAVAGALLGTSVLISSFAGLMFTFAAALHEGVSVVKGMAWWRGVVHATAASAPLVASAAIVTLLQYVDRGGSVLLFGLNSMATHAFVQGTLLSLGPLLWLSLALVLVALRERMSSLTPLAALAMTCVLFYFFVDIRDHQNVYVGWRAGHLFFIGCAVGLGVLFERMAHLTRGRRMAAFSVVGLLIAPAAPTLAIDVYNTQDITNRQPGPGFPWTLVLTHAEVEAFEWIEHNTQPDAVFQVDAVARGTATWALLPAFAERRMAAGLPISMVPLRKYEQQSDLARWIFTADDPKNAHDFATQMAVDYIYVGDVERAAHPQIDERFGRAPSLLPMVYQNDAVTIYAVAKVAGAASQGHGRSLAPR